MLIAVGTDEAATLVEHLNDAGETAAIVGELVQRTGEAVTFEGRLSL
jgi:phosphoribosylformylglycinamidine cyclo-ligase